MNISINENRPRIGGLVRGKNIPKSIASYLLYYAAFLRFIKLNYLAEGSGDLLPRHLQSDMGNKLWNSERVALLHAMIISPFPYPPEI